MSYLFTNFISSSIICTISRASLPIILDLAPTDRVLTNVLDQSITYQQMQSRSQHAQTLIDRRADDPDDEPSRYEVVAGIVASKEMDFDLNDGFGYQGIGAGNSDSSDLDLDMDEEDDAEWSDSGTGTGRRPQGRSFFDPWFVWEDYMDSRIR